MCPWKCQCKMLCPATYYFFPHLFPFDFWVKYDLDMFVRDSLKYSPTVRLPIIQLLNSAFILSSPQNTSCRKIKCVRTKISTIKFWCGWKKGLKRIIKNCQCIHNNIVSSPSGTCVYRSISSRVSRQCAADPRLIGNVSVVVAVAVFMVDDQQDHSQEEAHGSHCDVGDSQERVFPTHPRNGAEDHTLAAVKAAHWVIWVRVIKECYRISTYIWTRNFKDSQYAHSEVFSRHSRNVVHHSSVQAS